MDIPRDLLQLVKQHGIPEWALWLAQDADGLWWWYQAEPLMQHQGWYENEIGVFQRLGATSPPDNWRQRLYRVTELRDQTR